MCIDYSRSDPIVGPNDAFLWLEGLPGRYPKAIQPTSKRAEPGGGMHFWGSRIIVPPQGREKILTELHQGHPGMARMKALARSFVWWPGIDKDLENSANPARKTNTFQQQLQSNHGNSLNDHGHGSILIMLAHFKDTCS